MAGKGTFSESSSQQRRSLGGIRGCADSGSLNQLESASQHMGPLLTYRLNLTKRPLVNLSPSATSAYGLLTSRLKKCTYGRPVGALHRAAGRMSLPGSAPRHQVAQVESSRAWRLPARPTHRDPRVKYGLRGSDATRPNLTTLAAAHQVAVGISL